MNILNLMCENPETTYILGSTRRITNSLSNSIKLTYIKSQLNDHYYKIDLLDNYANLMSCYLTNSVEKVKVYIKKDNNDHSIENSLDISIEEKEYTICDIDMEVLHLIGYLKKNVYILPVGDYIYLPYLKRNMYNLYIKITNIEPIDIYARINISLNVNEINKLSTYVGKELIRRSKTFENIKEFSFQKDCVLSGIIINLKTNDHHNDDHNDDHHHDLKFAINDDIYDYITCNSLYNDLTKDTFFINYTLYRSIFSFINTYQYSGFKFIPKNSLLKCSDETLTFSITLFYYDYINYDGGESESESESGGELFISDLPLPRPPQPQQPQLQSSLSSSHLPEQQSLSPNTESIVSDTESILVFINENIEQPINDDLTFIYPLFKDIHINKHINKKILSEDDECPITQEKFTTNQLYYLCQQCNKCFDYESGTKWILTNRNCPHCRYKFKEIPQVYINI